MVENGSKVWFEVRVSVFFMKPELKKLESQNTRKVVFVTLSIDWFKLGNGSSLSILVEPTNPKSQLIHHK